MGVISSVRSPDAQEIDKLVYTATNPYRTTWSSGSTTGPASTGSASELTTAQRIARARGYITAADHAALDAALDRVRAMLWRLTH